MVQSVRIGLVGAGSVGSLLAAALLANEQAFSWVVRNPRRRKQLRDGLALRLNSTLPAQSPDELFLPVELAEVVDSAAGLPRLDWLLLAVKAQHVAPLLQLLDLHANPMQMLVVANGLHTGDYHLGILEGGAWLDADGTLVTTHANDLFLGALGSTAHAAQLSQLQAALRCPWLHPSADDSLQERMWLKLAKNCIINPLTALLDLPNGALLPLLAAPLATGLAAELAALAQAEARLAAPLSPEELLLDVRRLVERTAGNSSSMREDLRAGRPTEIAMLNFAAAAAGRARGLDCALTLALGQAVLSLEQRSIAHPRPGD